MTNFEDPNFKNGRPVMNPNTNNIGDYSNDSNGHWSTTNSQCGITASTKSLYI